MAVVYHAASAGSRSAATSCRATSEIRSGTVARPWPQPGLFALTSGGR
jgi:hypothetical protein